MTRTAARVGGLMVVAGALILCLGATIAGFPGLGTAFAAVLALAATAIAAATLRGW